MEDGKVSCTTETLAHYLRDSDGSVVNLACQPVETRDYIIDSVGKRYSDSADCEELRYLDVDEAVKTGRRLEAEVECPAGVLHTMQLRAGISCAMKSNKLYFIGAILCCIALLIQLFAYLGGIRLMTGSEPDVNPVLLGLITSAIFLLSYGFLISGYMLAYRARKIAKADLHTVEGMLKNLTCYRDVITEWRLDEQTFKTENGASAKQLAIRVSTNLFDNIQCGVDGLGFFPTLHYEDDIEQMLKEVGQSVIGRQVYVFRCDTDFSPKYSAYLGSVDLYELCN